MQEEYSVAVWVKPLGNHYHYNGTIFSSGNWNHTCYAFGLSQDNSQVDILCKGYNIYLTCAVPVNTWTHLVCTCDTNNVVRLYKNGEYINSSARSDKPDSDNANRAAIGRETYANGYFTFNGMLNDFRLYDHCLSPMEIKEISKGLILHYPLNRNGWGQENLIKNNLIRKDGRAGGITFSNSTLGNEYISISGTATADINQWLVNLTSLTNITNTTITISTNEIISNSARKIFLSTTKNGSWYRDVIPSLTASKYFTVILEEGETPRYLRILSQKGQIINSNLHFKLEIGDKPTPWCPNSSDVLATTMGLNDNIQYDTSGYNNNLKNFNKSSFSSDTPKYNVSTELAGTSYGTHQYLFLNDSYQKELTVSCWIKRTSSENTRRYISNSWIALYLYSDFAPRISWRNSTGTSDTLNTWAPGGAIPINTWTHICFTIKDGIVKYYKNGTYISTSDRTQYGTLIHGSLSNGFGGESLTSNNWIGGLSDFCIYCTALSAEDILSLYNNSAYIDNQGNIYGAIYEEV